MNDPQPEDISELELLIEDQPDGPDPGAVSFVVPASAYDSIATDEELARVPQDYHSPAISYSEPDLSPALKAIEGLNKSLGEKLDALGTRFDREIRAESTREKVVDRLHAELQEYKQGLLLSALRPVFIDLIQLHDDVGKMASANPVGDSPDGDRSRVTEIVRVVQEGIEDILYRQGVEPFQHESDAFDARRQRAISTVPTEDPDLAKKVAERHRRGFVSGDKVIRPEIVSVYVFKSTSA